jgi:hypothetical protein
MTAGLHDLQDLQDLQDTPSLSFGKLRISFGAQSRLLIGCYKPFKLAKIDGIWKEFAEPPDTTIGV